MIDCKLALAAIGAAAILAGCGGVVGDRPEDRASRVDVLASNARGMESIVFTGGSAYLSLSNTATEGSAVLRAAGPVIAATPWAPVALGACGVGKSNDNAPPRAPALKLLGSTLWLFQPWYEGQGEEHALCALNTSSTAFLPQDQGLRTCYEQSCYTLWMDDLKMSGTRLYTNAGAGNNLFVSDNGAASWRVLLGQFDAMMCYHQSFHIVGTRLLVGGECPLDMAFLRAYQLSPDGARLESPTPVSITVPELENRNIQFIESIAGTQRVFVGVEGGLLRSDDGGRTFKFVIHHAIEGGNSYPYVGSILSPAGKPNVLVVGGFDKANAKPYLAWSADGGDSWKDLSALLPGYSRPAGQQGVAQVTSLAQDPQGRLMLTLNEDDNAKGKLMLLTLGKP